MTDDTYELWWVTTGRAREGRPAQAQPLLVTFMLRDDATWLAHGGFQIFGAGATLAAAAENLTGRLSSYGNEVLTRTPLLPPTVPA